MPLLFYLFYFIYIFMGVLYAYLVMRYLLLLIDISVNLATLVKNGCIGSKRNVVKFEDINCNFLNNLI